MAGNRFWGQNLDLWFNTIPADYEGCGKSTGGRVGAKRKSDNAVDKTPNGKKSRVEGESSRGSRQEPSLDSIPASAPVSHKLPKQYRSRNVYIVCYCDILLKMIAAKLSEHKNLNLFVPLTADRHHLVRSFKRVKVLQDGKNRMTDRSRNPMDVVRDLALKEIDTLILCLPPDSELLDGMNWISILRQVMPTKRVVYISRCDYQTQNVVDSDNWPMMTAGEISQDYIEKGLLALFESYGVLTTILGPAPLFEHDMKYRQEIVEDGIYPLPLGRTGASRVSAVDVASAVSVALLSKNQAFQRKINLGTRKWYTDDDLAAIWTKEMGDEVAVYSVDNPLDDMEVIEEGICDRVSYTEAAAHDLRIFYEKIRAHGYGLSDEQAKIQRDFLGRELESYEEFVAWLAGAWKKQETESGRG